MRSAVATVDVCFVGAGSTGRVLDMPKSTSLSRRRHQRNRRPLVWSRWRQASI